MAEFIQFPSLKVPSKYKYTFHLFHDTILYSTGFVHFPFVRRKGSGERGRLCVSNLSPYPSAVQQASHLCFLYTAMANPVRHLTAKKPNV